MKLALVSCALIAGVAVASFAAPVQFPKSQQQVMEQAPLAAMLSAKEAEADMDTTASIGEGLTCEQIRLMDEVEFITDDSYCGDRG
jgi:hypothetical protein